MWQQISVKIPGNNVFDCHNFVMAAQHHSFHIHPPPPHHYTHHDLYSDHDPLINYSVIELDMLL